MRLPLEVCTTTLYTYNDLRYVESVEALHILGSLNVHGSSAVFTSCKVFAGNDREQLQQHLIGLYGDPRKKDTFQMSETSYLSRSLPADHRAQADPPPYLEDSSDPEAW